jgi:hypothetical protein
MQFRETKKVSCIGHSKIYRKLVNVPVRCTGRKNNYINENVQIMASAHNASFVLLVGAPLGTLAF